MPATQLRITSDGVELAVYRYGKANGIPLLLVHGYPDSHSTWLPLIEQLSEQFLIFSYDVRGAGASDKPAATRAYKLAQLSRDLLAVAAAISPDRRMHLIAHDWGSIQSWQAVCDPMATKHLASFTTISGPCLDHVGLWMRSRLKQKQFSAWWQVISQLLHSWYIAFFHLPLLPELIWRAGLAKHWARIVGWLEGVTPHANPTQLSDALHGIKLYRANFIGRMFSPNTLSTLLPVLLVIPTSDRFVRPQLFSELSQWVASLRIERVKAGHWQLLSQPEQLAQWISQFVNAHEQRTEAATTEKVS